VQLNLFAPGRQLDPALDIHGSYLIFQQ
jgi:hypothetical protein